MKYQAWQDYEDVTITVRADNSCSCLARVRNNQNISRCKLYHETLQHNSDIRDELRS